MDKNKIIKQVNNIILSNIIPLFDIIDDLENKISSLNISIKEKEERIITLSKQYDEVYFKSVDEQKRILDEKINLLKNEQDKLDKLRNSTERDVNNLSNKKNKLSDSILKLNKHINKLNNDKNDLLKYEVIKENILNDINLLNKEQNKIKKDIEKDIENRNNKIKELDKIILEKEKEHQKQLDKIIPSLEEVENRRKQLSIRESDLRTIVERYKKLYADKNAGFKV